MDKQKKQLPVVLGCLIKDGNVLLDQRFEPANDGAHLKWELPGGKIEFGETPEEAIVREFLEETGMHVQVRRMISPILSYLWEYEWGTQQVLLIGYELEYLSEQPRREDAKIKAVAWIPLDRLDTTDCIVGTKELIAQASS